MLRCVLSVILLLLAAAPARAFNADEFIDLRFRTVPGGQAAPLKTWVEPVTGMEFVWIPGGCFLMGQSGMERTLLIKCRGKEKYEKEFSHELPQHEVCLDGFWMGLHEVTQGQWEKVMGWNKSWNKGPENPVDYITRDEALDFIAKLGASGRSGFRLPTEAEWEYAARAGTTTFFCTGDTISTDQANYHGRYACDSRNKGIYRGRSIAVGSFDPNGFGLYDMSGNVWEMCADWYDEDAYSKHDRRNPVIKTVSDYQVIRGGSWNNLDRYARSAARGRNRIGNRGTIGLRLVRIP